MLVAVEPEALIAEARRRQRKRRVELTLIVATAVAVELAAYVSISHSSTHSSATSGSAEIGQPTTLQLRLRGFDTPLPTQVDQGSYPQGRTLIGPQPGGSVVGCVRTIRKLGASSGVKRITQAARALLANTFRDPEILTRQTRHLERWIDSL